MKVPLIVVGVASLIAGSALVTGPAQASWAESAQSRDPVYTGTDQSHWRAERSRRHYSWGAPRAHLGYDAYGYAPGYMQPSYGYYGPGFYYR